MTCTPRQKKNMALIACALLAFLAPPLGQAAPVESQWVELGTVKPGGGRTGVGIWGGYGLFANDQFGSGAVFGVSFLLGLSRNLALEFAAGYFGTGVENGENALPKGKLSAMPLQLSLQARFPLGKKLTPYLLAGGSYFLNDFSIDSSVVDGWSSVGITLSEKVAAAFGFHGGAGLELALGPSWSVNLEARYLAAKTESEWSAKDNVGQVESSGTLNDITLDTLVFALGLKYFFN